MGRKGDFPRKTFSIFCGGRCKSKKWNLLFKFLNAFRWEQNFKPTWELWKSFTKPLAFVLAPFVLLRESQACRVGDAVEEGSLSFPSSSSTGEIEEPGILAFWVTVFTLFTLFSHLKARKYFIFLKGGSRL